MAGCAVARIGRDAHLPDIETGIGPSETKAEKPARKKGFWNRFDAMAKAARWRNEITELRPPNFKPLRPRGRNIGKVGLSEPGLGFAKLSGDAKLLESLDRKTGLGTAGR